MKQKNVFGRFFSAILILFGFAIFGFAGTMTVNFQGNTEQEHVLNEDFTILNIRNDTNARNLIQISVPSEGDIIIDPKDNDFYSVSGRFVYAVYTTEANPANGVLTRSGKNFSGPITHHVDATGMIYIYFLLNDSNGNPNYKNKILKANQASIKFIPTHPDPTGPADNVCKATKDKDIGIDDGILKSPITYSFDGITKYGNGKYAGFYGEIKAESAGTVSVETNGNCKASIETTSPTATDCEAGATLSKAVNKDEKFYIRVSPNDNAENDISTKCEVKVNFVPVDDDKGSCAAFNLSTLGYVGETLNNQVTYTANNVILYPNDNYTGFYGTINITTDGTVTAENCSNVAISVDETLRSKVCVASENKSLEVKGGSQVYVHISPMEDAKVNQRVDATCVVKFTPKDGTGPGGSGGTPGGGGDDPIIITPPTPTEGEPRNDLSDDDIPNDGNFSKDFTGISDYKDQKIEKLFGGIGSYVYGDYAVTGNSVLDHGNYPEKSMTAANATYRRSGGLTLNGSSEKMELPKGLTKEDIVYVRLYWQGHIFDSSSIANGKSNSKGWKEVELKINSSPKLSVTADKKAGQGIRTGKCNGFVMGASGSKLVKYRMVYGCTEDITQLVKDNLDNGYIDNLEFTVGNIKTSSGRDTGGTTMQNGNFEYGGRTILGPYGGWGVVLVYNKTTDSQEALVKTGTIIGENQKQRREYIETYFKPKSVAIYGHYTVLTPWDGVTPKRVESSLDGFFTPRKGKVNAKLSFIGMAADSPYAGGEYFKVEDQNEKEKNKNDEEKWWKLLTNSENPIKTSTTSSVFNGTKTILKPGSYEPDSLKSNPNTHGFDLDEFDISEFMKNSQNYLKFALGSSLMCGSAPGGTPAIEGGNCSGGGRYANQNFISMIGVSVDIYVPKLCYVHKFYDTLGWLGFYNANGSRKKPSDATINTAQSVVAGETLFYRTEIRNQDEGGESETALGTVIKIDTGRYNTYQENSSAIDNSLKITGANGLTEADFKYLIDNQIGAYNTLTDRENARNPITNNDVYNGKQLNKYENRQLEFYVGEDAGSMTSDGPAGGTLEMGKSVYLEFNATVGNTATYQPMTYRASYVMKLADSDTVIKGPDSPLSVCPNESDPEATILFLNGLKMVNQNFKDLKDTNKTNAQDDRLYTQVAELPFDINMIFKPDINDLFKCPAENLNSDGKTCRDWNKPGYDPDNGEDLCDAYSSIFARKSTLNGDGSCQPIKTKTLADGTEGIDYDLADGSLQKFPLEGNLYLSAIRARDKGSCYNLTDRSKLPFKIDGTRYTTDYDTKFKEYQDNHNTLIMPVEKMELEDAFEGATFMFSYRPRGLESTTIDTTSLVADLNSTILYEYDENGTAMPIEDITKYFVRMQIELLYEKYIQKTKTIPDAVRTLLTTYNVSGYKTNQDEPIKRHIENEWLEKTVENDKFTKEREEFEAEKEKIITEIELAQSFFGTKMSLDGSFHVCDSDSFVVRPAYFEADMDVTTGYAKLVDTNANGDITKAKTIKHENNYRIGGDYTENSDILGNVFYAKSANGNPVPNYNAIIGGDLGTQRFTVRNSYNNRSVTVSKDGNATMAYRENMTFLKPFISNECYNDIESQALYIERDLNKQNGVKRTEFGDCTNSPVKYNGFNFNDGRYTLTDTPSKETNSTQRYDFGKLTEKVCLVEDDKGLKKEFDVFYKRLWDKNAISLTADFGVSATNISSGAAKIKRYAANELLAQAILEPKNKDKRPAALYTSVLFKDSNASEMIGAIFNYYNVGDVLVSLYDNSWTDAYGDQTFDSRTNSDDEYWGSKCIINSTSNVHDDTGRIGCDVGMINSESLVLRYQPAKINVALAGLKNSRIAVRDHDKNETTFAYENIRSETPFTYFNQVDIEQSAAYDSELNQAITSQLRNLAQLQIGSNAYLSDKVYPNVIATLYDGKKVDINDAKVSKCGFADNFLIKIIFDYDCQTNPSDSRCVSGTTAIPTRSSDYQYRPFANKLGIPSKFVIDIDTNTQLLDSASCNANLLTGFDSRCFKVNNKTINSETTTGSNGFQEAVPLKYAMNMYSDISENSGLLNEMDTVSGFYNPKADPFRILATAYDQGKTVHHPDEKKDAKIYINFDRMQKTPQNPVLVYVSDFNITRIDENATITPASFDKDFNLLSTLNSETHTSKVDLEIVKDFEEYRNLVEAEYNATVSAALTTSALFIYGKVNETSDGRNTATGLIGKTIDVDIYSMLYCPGDCSRAKNLFDSAGKSISPYAPIRTVFDKLIEDNAEKTGGFMIQNTTDRFGATDIQREFASRYIPKDSDVSVIRTNSVTNGVEPISIKCDKAARTTVQLVTNPWLIFTPANNDPTVYTMSSIGINDYASSYTGVPQFNNNFNIRCIAEGNWGGKGGRKDGDIVGNFITMEDDLNATTKVKTGTKERDNSRLDW